MTTANRETEHTEHLQEMRDLVQWLQDIDRWRAEKGDILDMLARVQSALFAQQSTFETFCKRIRTLERKVLEREESLATTSEPFKQRTNAKQEEEEKLVRTQHADLREVHEHYQVLHERVLEKANELYCLATTQA
jgi:hypothetical protein